MAASMTKAMLQAAAQSISISPNPPPRNLAESKLVLAALQKFGEVVMFRNMKYDPGDSTDLNPSIIAMLDSADSASRAIASSPLTIPLPEKDTQAESHTKAMAAADPWLELEAKLESKYPKSMTCHIEKTSYNHQLGILRNPYSNAYHVNKNTYQYHDLVYNNKIPLKELADGLMGRKQSMPYRLQRRIHAQNIDMGAHSLMKMYETGMKAQAEAKASMNAEGEQYKASANMLIQEEAQSPHMDKDRVASSAGGVKDGSTGRVDSRE